MSFADENPYASTYGGAGFAASATVSERTVFIRRTYLHLGAAVLAFIGIEMAIFQATPPQTLMDITIWMAGGWHWLLVLGGFMVVSMVADRWARSSTSLGMQYAGLALYVVAEAVIFIPLLLMAERMGAAKETNLIASAGMVTAVVFAGLTAIVFLTRADFSWLGRYLMLGGFIALAVIVGGIVFGFNLGLFFIGAMIALASGYILYYTSNILHHYRLDQYVAASLALFASVALLFWYVLQLFMSRD